MVEGLWIVQYEGIAGGDGGVIVFVRNQVLGGDSAFVYTGDYKVDGNTISARVLVRNFNPAVPSVLGTNGNFDVVVRGTIQAGIIRGSASQVDQRGPGMVVKLTKIAELSS